MSLINQALRKAQRDRTPPRMADPEVGTHPTGAPHTGMKPILLFGLLLSVALLVGLVAGLSVVLLKNDDAAAVAQEVPVTPAEASEQASSTSNLSVPPAQTKPELAEPLRPATAAATETMPRENLSSNPLVEELRKAREAAEAKLAAEEKAAEAEAARAAAQPNQEIIDWLTNAQVSGVRLSETESKVILNGKAYAVGEHVNYALGLKLMIIEQKRLLFVDENGKKYMKRI